METKGYYEELNSIKEEVRQNIVTTQATLLADIIRSLELLSTTNTPELTLTIVQEHGSPVRIVRTHTVYKNKV